MGIRINTPQTCQLSFPEGEARETVLDAGFADYFRCWLYPAAVAAGAKHQHDEQPEQHHRQPEQYDESKHHHSCLSGRVSPVESSS